MIDPIVIAKTKINNSSRWNAWLPPTYGLIAIRNHGVRIMLMYDLTAQAFAILQTHYLSGAYC